MDQPHDYPSLTQGEQATSAAVSLMIFTLIMERGELLSRNQYSAPNVISTVMRWCQFSVFLTAINLHPLSTRKTHKRVGRNSDGRGANDTSRNCRWNSNAAK
jgi:hypothetical protein